MKGCQENNSPSDPYLAEDKWRKILFPAATEAAVASQIPEHLIQNLQSLDVAEEQMI